MLRALSLIIALFVGSAHADPVASATCTKKGSATFAVISIKTGYFAPSNQSILEYNVTVGKLDANGRVASQKGYAIESNMKIFDNAAQAASWVRANPVVIPLSDKNETSGVVVLDFSKKSASLIDTEYETLETLDCVEN